MDNIWFTADEHYNHANVIKHMKRPFASIAEMNSTLIANHNSLVKSWDRVYHIGDFAWQYQSTFLDQLNGNHYLIRGNHDHMKRLAVAPKFIWVKDTYNLKVGNDSFFLSHYAHRVWNKSHYGAYHLYGHSHGMIDNYGRSMDVGVDAHNYYPVSLEQVISVLSPVDNFVNHHPSN